MVDMYMLWGGGPPFKTDGDGTKQLFDKKGSTVKLLGRSSYILEELKGEDKWSGVIVAWVSSCDEVRVLKCVNVLNLYINIYDTSVNKSIIVCV